MARRKGKKKRVAAPFTEEDYEALRRKQNIKKIKASIKRAGGLKKLIKRGNYAISENTDIDELLNNLSDDLLRRLADSRKPQNKVGVMVRKYIDVRTIEEETSGKYNPEAHHIREIQSFSGSKATVYIDKLMSMAEYGENYRGWYAAEYRPESVAVINKTGKKIGNMIKAARSKHTDDEIYNHLKDNFPGGLTKLADEIERLILSVYDKEYRGWAGGEGKYDIVMNHVKEALDF